MEDFKNDMIKAIVNSRTKAVDRELALNKLMDATKPSTSFPFLKVSLDTSLKFISCASKDVLERELQDTLRGKLIAAKKEELASLKAVTWESLTQATLEKATLVLGNISDISPEIRSQYIGKLKELCQTTWRSE
jgi:hypothetical protein